MWKRYNKRLARRLRSQRGQSMVAYAIISAVLLGGLTFASIRIFPDMLNAIDRFAGTIYFGLNLPFP